MRQIDEDDEAEQVFRIWSDAVADLCGKIGVDPKSFDWSPCETTEETVGNIMGKIAERIPDRRMDKLMFTRLCEITDLAGEAAGFLDGHGGRAGEIARQIRELQAQTK